MIKLFVDLNSVLSDFDSHYIKTIGPLPDNWRDHTPSNQVSSKPPVTGWSNFDHSRFYATMPPMQDMILLWDYIAHYNPIILSGVPGANRHFEHRDTVAWVQRHIPAQVDVVTCLSKDKYRYSGPGTLNIDDWERYKHLWIGAGGDWITHTSAVNTIWQLRDRGL